MAPKKTGIAKITDTEQATAIIQEWFQRENRPVTAQSLTDALGSRVRKPLVLKTLDELLANQQLQCKDLKKVRFFFLNVTKSEPTENTTEGSAHTVEAVPIEPRAESTAGHDVPEPNEEKQRAAELVEQTMALRTQNEAKEAELAQLANIPTSEERRHNLDALTAEVEGLRASVSRIQSAQSHSQGTSHTTDVNTLLSDYHTARGLWKERKEFTLRLVDGVLGDTCTLSELSDLFGITTDEAAHVSFRESALNMPRALRSHHA